MSSFKCSSTNEKLAEISEYSWNYSEKYVFFFFIYICLLFFIYIYIYEKKKNFLKLLIFFVIIFISADPIFFLDVRSASSDKEIMRNF